MEGSIGVGHVESVLESIVWNVFDKCRPCTGHLDCAVFPTHLPSLRNVSKAVSYCLLCLIVQVHHRSGIVRIGFHSNSLEPLVAPLQQETQAKDAGKCKYLESQSTAPRNTEGGCILIEPEVVGEQRRQICQGVGNTNRCGSLDRRSGDRRRQPRVGSTIDAKGT